MSISDDQIAQIFGSLGRIEQKIDSHIDTVDTHIGHDEKVQKLLFERVEGLQFDRAKQTGAARVWSMVYGAVGALLGAVASYYGGKH